MNWIEIWNEYSAAWKFVNPLVFSIFLHKYDPKHHQIFTQVLKVDKVNSNQINETQIYLLFGEQWLSSCNSAMQWLFSVLLMVDSWTLTSAPVRKASCLKVTLWSFATLWTITSLAEGNSGLEFLQFVHNLSDCGFVESKLFRDGFVSFSSLMSNINSFSKVLGDLLCLCHDTLPQTWSDFKWSLFFK